MKKISLIVGWGWWRAIITLPLLGLSACYLDGGSRPRQVDYTDHNVSARQVVVEQEGRHTKSSVKDPVQESTPGPKHVAAPKLPVIQ